MGMIQRREAEAQNAPIPTAPVNEPRKLATKPYDEGSHPMDLKTRQIQAQGCWQAAASNAALIGYAADIEALKIVVRELAEDGLKFIEEKTK